jgi:hemoglobin
MIRASLHIAAVVTMLLALCACAGVPRRTTLYQDLGEMPGITKIVDEIIVVYADDPRVAPFFANSNIKRFRAKLIEYLCKAADGPCKYTGDDMQETHTGLGIGESAFNAGVEGFQTAMTRLHVAQTTQNRLLARLAPQRRDIIER